MTGCCGALRWRNRCTGCGHRQPVDGVAPVQTREQPFWTWPGELIGRYRARHRSRSLRVLTFSGLRLLNLQCKAGSTRETMTMTGVNPSTGFTEVMPTAEEKAAWDKKRPRQAGHYPYRSKCSRCGRRIWHTGIAIGSHRRACKGR